MSKIYVACLASYNNGCLHGKWFDLDHYCDVSDLQDAINRRVMLTSPYPNVMVRCPDCDGEGVMHTHRAGIKDVEVRRKGLPSIVETSECHRCKGTGQVPSAEEWAVHDYDDMPSRFGEYPSLADLFEHVEMTEKYGQAWEEFVDRFGEDVSESNFESAYVGEFDNEVDFAQDYAEQSGIDSNNPAFYWIDWERAWSNDLRHSYSFDNGYVFRTDW